MDWVISAAKLETSWQISKGLPEFTEPYSLEEYQRRTGSVRYLNLVAWSNEVPIGFKLGYALDDQVFYSWLGGVLPAYRRQGIARSLALAQEEWLIGQGYQEVRMKTRNIHKRMIIFALQSGFNITAVEPQPEIEQFRIYLMKKLVS
ncbi:MAG TPA: GNAT family N-acetyltransferase [Saprospiraceae bacterium]|nr:GNAT family N-acetyltransferase [Saprospiraceae bacterium]MCB9270711.1 GNAT family N-acetyltransferase [Lewinellaceae bacterium]HPG05919.1 GNAT family N-acetyltransferase [Saprospiraceae bacterium]HPR00643.1 GNAT family N-acetyltransferase [Saprospiraceae bacterium]HQU53257.1 GNAT family N-acetyltransferase [Saprospiraceae bacterium]